MNWTFLVIMCLLFLIGCFGGFVNWLFFRRKPRTGESTYRFWYLTDDCDTRFPGLATNVPLGGLAAVMFWCLDGPYSGTVLIGPDLGSLKPILTVGQIPMSFFIGLGGATYILAEARRRCAEHPAPKQNGCP